MNRAHRSVAQAGFSLLEMMIAVVIGLFSVLVITQVMSGTSISRRIAMGGGDAQLNGVAGVRALAMDIEQAGLGLQSFNLLGCSLTYGTVNDGNVTLPALAPVIVNPAAAVVPAGDLNTDTLLVMSGNSSLPSEGDALTATSATGSYAVTTPQTFAVNDRVVAVPAVRAPSCALQVALVTGVASSALSVGNGVSGVPSGGIVYNLGPAPSVRAYAIRNGDLTVCDYTQWNCGSAANLSNAAVWVPVAGNIVSLRAQYARDTSGITGTASVMDGVADTYDQLTPGSAADPAAIALQCKWARVIGVRVVLVARSQQFDKTLAYAGSPNVGSVSTKTILPASAIPTWDGAAGAPINLTGLPSWDRYRYTTTQTALPLRNMIWQGGQPTYQGGGGAC